MYNTEDAKTLTINLKSYIEKELENKEKQLKKIKKSLFLANFIEEINNNYFSVEFIVNNKEKIIKLIPELENEVNIIDFFYKNNATNIEQFEISLTTFRKHKIFDKIFDIEKLQQEESELSKTISMYTNFIKGIFIPEEYIEVVESTSLKEAEKLLIYSQLAFESLKKEEVLIEESTPIKNDNIESITYDQCKNEYLLIKEKIQTFINKYYDLIMSKDKNYINYIKSYINIAKQEDNFTYDYKEEKLLIKIFEIIEQKEEIENTIKNIDLSQEELETLYLNIEIIKEDLDAIEKLSNEYEAEKEEEKLNESSNKVYFLSDENGNLFFDINSIEKEIRDKIPILIEKLNKGIYDYNKGIKHSKLQTSYKENTVFINKLTDIGCAFIRINEEKVLVLNIDYMTDIYNSTIAILNTKSNLINTIKTNISNSNNIELVKQTVIMTKLNNELKKGETPRI